VCQTIDEPLDPFRANSLLRNFEIKGGADRLLIVLTLFVSDCLAKVVATRVPPSALEATKALNSLAVDGFPLPDDANFPLNAHYAPPANRIEAGASPPPLFCIGSGSGPGAAAWLTIPCVDALRQYLIQARQETVARFVEKLYADGTGKPSKWWTCFTKRRFMNRSLGN
jgi:actin related protein 2/3 complex subunit 3